MSKTLFEQSKPKSHQHGFFNAIKLKVDIIMKCKLKITTLLLTTACLLTTVGCSVQQESINEQTAVTKNNLQPKELQQVKAYAKFVPIREDDFAWENDLVAFRVYGPSSLATPTKAASGVDTWLKRVDYSIIDNWYNNYEKKGSYHKDWGEGHDPYHTGISRGAGGTAIWIEGTPYPSSTFSAWRIIDNNPENLIFELDYSWQTKLGEVPETKQISLALGSQLFEVTSQFLLNGQPAKNLSIAIGLTTHDEAAKASFNKESGWISAWEKLKGYYLGTGVVVAAEQVDEIIHRPSPIKDHSHIWLISHTDEQGKLNYAAGYGWERAKKITTETQWQQYLSNYTLAQ